MKILGKSWGFDYYMQPLILLRGTILNRTYGLHQNQHIFSYFYSQYLVLFTMVPRNININSYNVHTAVSVLGFFLLDHVFAVRFACTPNRLFRGRLLRGTTVK